jgi:hypothetical protein
MDRRMPPESASLSALLVIGILIALPALDAWRRRSLSREASAAALALQEFALAVRQEMRCVPVDPALQQRVERLRRGVPEVAAFLLAPQLAHLSPEYLADAAQRLALRLKRRVAFERKMLARTTSGLRRGAVAAALPPVVALLLAAAGLSLPTDGLVLLLLIEALGCGLLWHVARVEI